MSDLLSALWWESYLRGDGPEARRGLVRAMLLVGTGNQFFEPFDGPVRIGLRRWDLA